jgi:hypothetical protein
MELHEDWQHILQHAWSVKWMIMAGVFDTGAVVVPVFVTAIPLWIFAALTFACVVGGIWARLLCQPKVGL